MKNTIYKDKETRDEVADEHLSALKLSNSPYTILGICVAIFIVGLFIKKIMHFDIWEWIWYVGIFWFVYNLWSRSSYKDWFLDWKDWVLDKFWVRSKVYNSPYIKSWDYEYED